MCIGHSYFVNKVVNCVVFLLVFLHSHHFIKLRLNIWSHMEYFNDVFKFCWGLKVKAINGVIESSQISLKTIVFKR